MNIKRSTVEDTLLVGLLAFAPLALASVHTWAYCTIAIASLILFNLHFLHHPGRVEESNKLIKVLKLPISIGLLAFLIINLLYIVPLPAAVIKLLSPAAYDLRKDYMLEPTLWQTLSVYSRATIGYLIKITSYIMVFLVVVSKIVTNNDKLTKTNEKRPGSSHFRFILLGALCSVLSILFHSLSDFNFHIPANALYFTVMLAIIAGLTTKNEQGTTKNDFFVHKLVNAIIIIAFTIAVFGILQKLSYNGKIYWTIVKPGAHFGPYVNYDHYAGYMEMCVFLAIAVFMEKIRYSSFFYLKKAKEKLIWLSSPEAGKTLIYLFIAIVMVTSLFLSTSRGGILSFSAVFLVFYFTSLISAKKSRRKRIFLAIVLVIMLITIMALWIGPEETINRFKGLNVIVRTFITERSILSEIRPYMWKDTLELIKDYWITGTGIGTYSYVFPKYRTFSIDWGFLRYAHNDYLQFIAEMGSMGFTFIAAFFIWYFRRFKECYRVLKDR